MSSDPMSHDTGRIMRKKGQFSSPKQVPTRRARKDHIHNVNLGKLPNNHGASFTTNKVISNNNGADRTTNQTMKSAKHQMRKHKVSLADS